MAHDDDADGFLGITFIPHGHDHSFKNDADESREKSSNKPKKSSKITEPSNTQLEKMHDQLSALEKELQDYEVVTEERLQHLERMAGHPITAEEKVFRIQEDS